MKLNDFEDLKLDDVDVVNIREKDGKIRLELYPPKAIDRTKDIILDNGDETPVNVTNEPVRQPPQDIISDKELELSHMSDEKLVWTALKNKVEEVFK